MKIAILNGPNLNLLGTREPEIYGSRSFEDFLKELKTRFIEVSFEYFQSNHEGALIDKLQALNNNVDGIIMNPAGYSHTSIALADTIAAINPPVVEVHISDIDKREAFRRHSYTALYAKHMIKGKGLDGYAEAVDYLVKLVND
jgi:3-dehydroquinate dehydratase-2